MPEEKYLSIGFVLFSWFSYCMQQLCSRAWSRPELFCVAFTVLTVQLLVGFLKACMSDSHCYNIFMALLF